MIFISQDIYSVPEKYEAGNIHLFLPKKKKHTR